MSRRIYMHVAVDLSDIDTEDLSEELQSRDDAPLKAPDEATTSLQEIYYALKFGLNDRAIELMRRHVSDQLGVVL